MLPTKTTKPSVFRIHGVVNKLAKSSYKATNVATKAKSCSKKRPKSVPLKRERMTFFFFFSKKIARRDGNKEKEESSIK